MAQEILDFSSTIFRQESSQKRLLGQELKDLCDSDCDIFTIVLKDVF